MLIPTLGGVGGRKKGYRTYVDGFTKLNNPLTLQSILLSRTGRMRAFMQRKPIIWAAREDRGRDRGGLQKVN